MKNWAIAIIKSVLFLCLVGVCLFVIFTWPVVVVALLVILGVYVIALCFYKEGD
jgi:uncharacterized membrane protein